jgi:hypothetical protein
MYTSSGQARGIEMDSGDYCDMDEGFQKLC